MKTLLVVLSFLVLATAAYAVNVGDVVGGYPVGLNYNQNGSVNPNFVDSIGEPATVPFTPSVTAVTPGVGTVEGGYPIGFAYRPGTATPSDSFLDQIGEESSPDFESVRGKSYVREGDMFNNTIRSTHTSNPVSNLSVLAIGSSSMNQVGYYVGYKVISINW
jgi:hypothetical protein